MLNAAVAKYGRFPGGIVVEGEATCDVRITALAYDPTCPSHLILNHSLHFDTGLTGEEIALLWGAAFDYPLATNFGAVSQVEVVGVEPDSLVAVKLMHADNAVGNIVYGHDSCFSLCSSNVPSYRNPDICETSAQTLVKDSERQCLNHLYGIAPQLFLKIGTTHVHQASPGIASISSTGIVAAIGVKGDDGSVVTSIPQLPCVDPLVAERFPFVYATFQDFVARFQEYAATDQSLVHAVRYAEVLLLLRRAKQTNASLFGWHHIRRLRENRRHIEIPRFNYTLRSPDYAERLERAALWATSHKWPSFWKCLTANYVGLGLARLAGSKAAFLACKMTLENCFKKAKDQTLSSDDPRDWHVVNTFLPEMVQKVQSACHDILIGNCFYTGLQASDASEQRNRYLSDVLQLIDASVFTHEFPGTQNLYLEIRSALYPSTSPIAAYAELRAQDRANVEPYRSLDRVIRRRLGFYSQGNLDAVKQAISRRHEVLSLTKLSDLQRQLWAKAQSTHEPEEALWILDELKRFDLTLGDYLAVLHNDDSGKLRPALFRLVANQLRTELPTSFSTRFLRRDNPFAFSHPLLDHEPLSQLEYFFASTRRRCEQQLLLLPERSRVRRGLSKYIPLLKPNDPASWWRDFLNLHGPNSSIGASKVALLLAYELNVRGLTVTHLYTKMRQHRTENPQAGLFFLDLEPPLVWKRISEAPTGLHGGNDESS